MTRYYLDTEFLDDGTQLKLISIALVCEDGRELYYALTDWLGNDGRPDPSGTDDWLRDNVFRNLPTCTCPGVDHWRRTPHHLAHRDDCIWRSRTEIAEAITTFIRVEPKDQIEIWAYFASYDWVLFCQLFGKMIDLPKHFPWLVNDLKTWSKHMGYTGKFRDLLPDAGHHIALEDARWNRDVHEILLKRFQSNGLPSLPEVQRGIATLQDIIVSMTTHPPPPEKLDEIHNLVRCMTSLTGLVAGTQN